MRTRLKSKKRVERTIFQIKQLSSSLSSKHRKILENIFLFDVCKGFVKPPNSMKDWIKKHFKNANVEEQTIVRVFNKQTFESALFNNLRALRPLHGVKTRDVEVKNIIKQKDVFCKPLTLTPADVFGRLKSKHCVTASNIAKYDCNHGLIIFKKHDPLRFSLQELQDYFRTAKQWFVKALKHDCKAVFPLIGWNCLWRAGASIIHGHMQVLLGRHFHYTFAEVLNNARIAYEKQFKTNYFEDLKTVYKALNMGFYYKKVFVTPSLTPAKEKEVLIMHSNLDNAFVKALFKTIQVFKNLNIESFNVAVFLPPLKSMPSWRGFPVIARILDRGSLTSKTSDIGFLELLAKQSIVSHDPFKLSTLLKQGFKS